MQILFLSYLTQAPLVLFYVFTEQCKPHLSGRITTFGFVLFLLLLLVLLNKSSVKIVLRSFNPLFSFFVSSPYFSMNSLLHPNTIAIAFQKHCNCTPISPLLHTNCIEFTKWNEWR